MPMAKPDWLQKRYISIRHLSQARKEPCQLVKKLKLKPRSQNLGAIAVSKEYLDFSE